MNMDFFAFNVIQDCSIVRFCPSPQNKSPPLEGFFSLSFYLCTSSLFIKLMKKGGGTGPVKPWQPVRLEKGAKSDPRLRKR